MKTNDPRWHQVFERDGGSCRYCGIDLLTTFEHYYFAEVDHLLPKSFENRDDPVYLVLACRACNGRLSQAHRLGHTTFESRLSYLKQTHLSKPTRDMYEHYLKKRKNGWT